MATQPPGLPYIIAVSLLGGGAVYLGADHWNANREKATSCLVIGFVLLLHGLLAVYLRIRERRRQ